MLGWSKGYENHNLAGCAVLESDLKVLENMNDAGFWIPLKKEQFNDGVFSNEDGKMYIKQSGTYLIMGKVAYKADTTHYGSRWAVIRKNGTSENIADSTVAPNSSTGGMSVNTSAIVKLKAGEYLEFFGGIGGSYQNSTANDLIAYAGSGISIVRLAD